MRAGTARAADGCRLAYDVSGDGPALVLVPGLLMDRRRWHDAGYVGRLARRHLVLSVDPLGQGGSDAPHDAAAYDLPVVAGHVTAVLDAEGISRAVVWGFSRGAVVALAAAVSSPDRVAAVVAGGLPDDPAAMGRGMALDALEAGDWASYWATFPAPLPADARTRFEAGNDPRAVAAAGRALARTRLALPHGPPVLVYVGDGAPLGGATRAAVDALGAEVVVLPTGGSAETFRAVDPVLAAVEPFLAAATPR